MPWLRLLRLPNVFTAVADVLLGYLVVRGAFDSPALLIWLIAASCLLYLAGMVLNDVYDLEQDARERPERPIPSGRIDAALAHRVGLTMLAGGVAAATIAATMAAWQAAWTEFPLRPPLVAAGLAALVWLYDRKLKRTPLGPIAMGGCRTLNVLLGMSLPLAIDGAAPPWQAMHFVLAGGIGVYIAGVTWFARREAAESSRVQLAAATAVMIAGLGLVGWYPAWWPHHLPIRFFDQQSWWLLWGVLAALIGYRCLWAVLQPSPALVQRAVKNAILSLIVIDAAAALPAAGPLAVVIALLLLPTMVIGQWIYST